MHKIIFKFSCYINTLIFLCLLSLSFSASAVVTYQSISSDLLVNRYPGDLFSTNDIYWQGGSSDIEILPDGAPYIPGSNTIGSSVFGIYTVDGDIFADNLFPFSFERTTFSFANKLEFGSNNFSSLSSFAEVFDFQDGLLPGFEQTLSPTETSFAVVNEDNTGAFNLFTQAVNNTYEASSIAGFYLNAGQDPNTVFADASLFSGLDPFFTGLGTIDINQQGVIDQFNYLIDDVVDATWQSLAIYYWDVDVLSLDGQTQFATGYLGGSFVSYDAGAIPTAQVPEPSTYLLFGLGLVGLVGFSRRQIKGRSS